MKSKHIPEENDSLKDCFSVLEKDFIQKIKQQTSSSEPIMHIIS